MRLPRFLALLLLQLGVALAGATTYTGPVPAPTDAIGGPGAYAVQTRTIPSPSWSGAVVTIYAPVGLAGPRPTVFFSHGYSGTSPLVYDDLLNNWASHGFTVVFSPYPLSGGFDYLYGIMFDGFVAAANTYPDLIDTSRVMFAGHSYGGGASPNHALRAWRDKGWGRQGLALFLLAPWYSGNLSNDDLAQFPATAQLVAMVYADDLVNDHRMAIDVFNRISIPAENKDFLLMHSDRVEGYAYNADHSVPSTREARANDALDSWGTFRIGVALALSAFEQRADARAIALGNGSDVQIAMGSTAAGRVLRPLSETDTPVPLYPQSRYAFAFGALVNPRRGSAPAEATPLSGLYGLSARARSGEGSRTLIAGVIVEGSKPKDLLIRAVGPTLAAFGLTQTMTDPRLALFGAPSAELTNDNWGDDPWGDVVSATTEGVGVFRLVSGAKDSALTASFSPGIVTAHAQVASGSTGVALIELYNADLDPDTRLRGLSTRAYVSTGDDVLIVGFTLTGAGNHRVLVRAVGPTLGTLGVDEVLADPEIDVVSRGTVIAHNDHWSTQADGSDLSARMAAAGLFPLPAGSKDAALALTLAAGNYTVVVRGTGNTVGNALAEVYLER